jgi:hypothetical protein
MITTGIDLASQPLKTAACSITWADGRAEVTSLIPGGVDDAIVLDLLTDSDKVGLDVPLGWPVDFVAAASAHAEGRPWPGANVRQLRFRETDRYVARQTKRWPLSVSSDLIAVPAFRAAALMAQLSFPIDRSGSGRIVEAYPAAALRRWEFDPLRYKRKAGSERREALVSSFRETTSEWLRLTATQWDLCVHGDDAFDAMVAAIVARMAARGLCDPVPPESAALARLEGWIALPVSDSLKRVANSGPE